MIHVYTYGCACSELAATVEQLPIACPGHGDPVTQERTTDDAPSYPQHVCGWYRCEETP